MQNPELEKLQKAVLGKMELLNKQMEELRLYYLAEAEKITGVPQKSPWKKNGK